ncbi:unnamed protein product [Trichogramma brassicae]|uniref:SMC hinge domain-containing protein n=1 Tax=Trichogramma brassicae TaxID=86971 RepID=A0A6H5IJG2_9HYME|nr:unnamed protein product [Trichogramma brassicae]
MTTESQGSSSEAMDVDPPPKDAEEEGKEENSDEAGGWRVSDDIYIPPPPMVFGEYDTKGPRLMIVKIVTKNFKSYAGTIEIGPFHKCFSAIVGPNGNGKSNAIDSMLFVFGYRANKIRTKKVAELIHNSNEHPHCSSCSVSVHFQQIIDKPGQDYDVIPNSEFYISRTAFKDSSSYYEINGRKAQFKQITNLLKSHHVDLDHNRFLILQEKSKLEDLEKVPEKNQKDIEECEKLQEKQLEDKEKEEAALVTLMSGLKEKTEPLIEKRASYEKKLVPQRKNVDETKSALDIAKSKLNLYTSEEQTEKNKLQELQEHMKTTSERLVKCKKELASIEPKIPVTEEELKGAQKELEALKARESEANARLRNTRLKFDEQKSAMQAGRSRNHILNSLMKEKREGRIPGIFGRLGDLGAIDAKYDVAISTACGPLDNIVVDTVNTATECIKFLRDNDIGRGTFIALEKQQRFARQCQEKIRTPDNVPRLFDLIQVEDERLLPAFYYAIQNTLVANDIDQATRIGYGAQRFRVVTLKGEMIELSGTMSGGGRTSARGRMGQKVARSEPTAQDIEKLQRELDQVYEEYNNVKALQPPLEEKIHSLNNSLKEMIVNKDKCKIEANQLSVAEPNLRKQLKEQEKKTQATVCDAKKVKELTKIVEEAEKRYNEALEDCKELENAVNHINQKIEEISGGRVKEQQKKISSLTKAIDKTKGEICRLQVAIKTAERNAKKAEQRIETLETEIKTKKPNVKKWVQTMKNILDVRKNYKKLQKNATQCVKLIRLLCVSACKSSMQDSASLLENLKEMYRMITLGGDAELELVDSLDPFSEGIVFSVRPPKKSWKYIQNLSGGEKTLSSLALVFALHHYKPTPVYFMDEIDAALDFKNVSIFIVISHRSDMFELADYLCWHLQDIQ